MRILVVSPIGPQGIAQEVLTSLTNQEGGNYFDLLFTRDNPYDYPLANVYRNIQINYEKARLYAVEQGYQKMWIVEADTIPPTDALKKLLEVDAEVVSGYYLMRHGEAVPNVFKYNPHAVSLGSVYKFKEIPWGETIRIGGGCMGCILIDRSVFTRFNFEYDSGKWAPDGPFMQWCTREKVKQMARLDVMCGHKRPDGKVLWPDQINGWRLE